MGKAYPIPLAAPVMRTTLSWNSLDMIMVGRSRKWPKRHSGCGLNSLSLLTMSRSDDDVCMGKGGGEVGCHMHDSCGFLISTYHQVA